MVVKDIENPSSQDHIQLLLILVPHLTVNENNIILLRLVRPEICVYPMARFTVRSLKH